MDLSFDTPAPGLQVAQPRRGFRYSVESFWLAGAADDEPLRGRALDLGTGSGVIALLLARRGWESVGVDLRPEWGPLWGETLARSAPVAARLHQLDVRDVEGSYEVVVSNPPFFPAAGGPAAPDLWKAAARTESTATLADFVAAAGRCLVPGGAAWMVVPREREGALLVAADAVGLCDACLHRVGRRRTLVRLARGGPRREVRAWGESDEPVRRWVERASG